MRPLLRDLWFGLRLLRRTPWFTVVAVLTLGIGIAVTTTVFGWIDAILLHPLPGVTDAHELALIETVTPAGEYLVNTSYLDCRDYRDQLRLVAGVALGRFTPLSIGADKSAVLGWAELVSSNYFEILKVKPMLGRTFAAGEDSQEGGAPVAVISYRMWKSRFAGDPDVQGKNIRLNRRQFTVIGVTPREFKGSLVGVAFDVWVPITMATAMGTGGGTLHYRGTRDITSTIVRLKPGVGVAQGRAEVAALGKRLAALYPATNRGIDLTLTPPSEGHLGAQALLSKALRILMAISLLLLLIACANIANLLLARGAFRQHEFAIRLAMGARRSRVLKQVFTETMLLACGGAAVGIAGTFWLRGSLLWLLNRAIDAPIDFGGTPKLTTIAFTVLTAAVATLLSGIAPAVFAAGSGLHEVLKESGRSGSAGAHSRRLRALLVISEMALAMVALTGAGLFYRSFQNARRIHPGFDQSNISVSQFHLSYAGYSAAEQHEFCRQLRERIEAKPGVIGVTYSDVVPMATASGAGSSPWHQLEIEGYTPSVNEQMMIHRATVPPGYFRLLGIRMIEGRDFTEQDTNRTPYVIIVNETFAARFFHRANPIGRKVRLERNTATVVGLVKDSKYHTPTEAPIPFFYIPFRQWYAPGLNFAVFLKTHGDPLPMTSVMRAEALSLNPDASFTTRLLSDATAGSLYAENVAATLLTAVGMISLLLAAVGLYSVMSFTVTQRTHEMGIRTALGAERGDLVRLVLKEGLMLTVPGLVAGAVIAVAASKLAGTLLVNVDWKDPATFVPAAAFLGLIAALASYVPALQAARVDPARALRDE